mgnify:CR=1 FL=1
MTQLTEDEHATRAIVRYLREKWAMQVQSDEEGCWAVFLWWYPPLP